MLVFALLGLVVEIVAAPVEWLWPARWGGSTHWAGATGAKRVALTFDDGPSRYTHRILDILEASNVPATFFVIGRQADRHGATLRRIAAAGHEIGNHGYGSNAGRFGFSFDAEKARIAETQAIVETLTSKSPRYFRPPRGRMGRGLLNAVRDSDLAVVYGALPLPPPSAPAERQLEVVRATLEPGAILILHDGDDSGPESTRAEKTVELLPMLLDELEQRGYEVVPLTALLEGE